MRQAASISLAVVGVHHANRDGSDRRFEIEVCAPGEPVELRPEPENSVDKQAVAVYSIRGVQLGYLTAERAGFIGGIIRSGREHAAVFQASTQFGAWIRLAFDGVVPVIRQSRVAVATDPQLKDEGFDDGWHEGWEEP